MVWVLASICWGLLPFTHYTFSALIFLVGVVLAGLRWRRGPVLTMAAVSALVWNFFFIPPRFTLHIDKPQDVIMFALFFLAALSMGHLTTRLHERERGEALHMRQTDALLQVAQAAIQAPGAGAGLADALAALRRISGADTILVLNDDARALCSLPESSMPAPPENGDRLAIEWCRSQLLPAGRFTAHHPEAQATWFPLGSEQRKLGLIGYEWEHGAVVEAQMVQLAGSLAPQLSLVLEKEMLLAAARRADVLEESGKLHRALLDSIAHELKTPIAVIRAALDGLPETGPYANEIRTANMRLQRIVESFLEMARMESGVLTPQKDWTDLNDVVHSAQEPVQEELRRNEFQITGVSELPLVFLDGRLLTQALSNVLHNGVIHSPAGSSLELRAMMEGDELVMLLRDHGPGLVPGEEEKIFGKFYRSAGAPAGGTGLGLAIARGFMRAQGGDLTARTHPDGGAEFRFQLPGKTTPV